MKIFPRLKVRIVHIPAKLWFGGASVYPFVFLTEQSNSRTLTHEEVHHEQQNSWWQAAGPLGWLMWFTLYLLILPVGLNPFRYSWEYEAYKKAQGYSDGHIDRILKSAPYFLWWT